MQNDPFTPTPQPNDDGQSDSPVNSGAPLAPPTEEPTTQNDGFSSPDTTAPVTPGGDQVATTSDTSFEPDSSNETTVSDATSAPATAPDVNTPPVADQAPAANGFFSAGTPDAPQSTDSLQPAVAAAGAVIGSGPVVAGGPASTPPKKKKGLIIGIVVAGALALLGGGGALAYNVWYQNPDKVIGDALVNTLTAKSLSATGSLDLKTDDSTITIKVDAKGKENTAEVAVDFNVKSSTTEFAVKGAGILSPEGDLYVKVENAQELIDSYLSAFMGASADTSAFDGLIQKVNNNWVKISKDDLGTVSEEVEKTQACYQDLAKQLSENKAWSDQLSSLYKSNIFIVVKEKLGAKSVNGTGSLGYLLDFDKAKAASFATGLADTDFGKGIKECDDSIDFAEVAKSLTEAEEDTSTARIEAWVSRFGHEFTELRYSDNNDSGDGVMVLNPTFNKEVTITTPSESVSFQELQTELEAAMTAYYTQLFQSYQQ
jgi:hypothetical protein